MSKKSEFINYVQSLMRSVEEPMEMNNDARAYWDALCGGEDAEKSIFTDNGKLIMKYLQEQSESVPMKAKDIAEGMFISSRTVSGSMRKLVSDGFVEKVGQDPIMYILTEAGKNIKIED